MSNLPIKILSLLLVFTAIFCHITSCTVRANSEDLMDGISANKVPEPDDLSAGNTKLTDFAVRMFKASFENRENTNGNILISPLSVLSALSMAMNGARGETLSQMEKTLGFTKDEVNNYLYGYCKNLTQNSKSRLVSANSMWIRDGERLSVKKEFLQANADYYDADIFKAPFDESTLNEINRWVEENTDGMIKKMIDRIPQSAVMYLINALTFDAEWNSVYEKAMVSEGIFNLANGDRTHVDFMHDTGYMPYFEDEHAKGFLKHYYGGKYAFAALLPDEDISVDEYIKTMSGEKIHSLLSDAGYKEVRTSIPKFESEYSTDLSDALKQMGITDAFTNEKADFTGIGTSSEGSIFIGRVLHKTYISVDEKGTKAGAATVVEMTDGAALVPEDIKEVYLDRPFIYMLIDCDTNTPFFIGTIVNPEK